MELGAFSVSLAVKDLAASQAFYRELGFLQVGGDAGQGWLILRNGHTTIGLFQGMSREHPDLQPRAGRRTRARWRTSSMSGRSRRA